MAKRSKSSHDWLQRRRRDRFARRAADAGLGSRAYFKLEALDARYRLLDRRAAVLVLGAAPGVWTRDAARTAQRVVACDLLPMAVPARVTFIEGDATSEPVAAQLEAAAPPDGFGLVLSDMAPNMSGNRVRDQALAMELFDAAEHCADKWLKPGGAFVVKMFQGDGFDAALARLRAKFREVHVAKPEASRPSSREVYAVALGFEPPVR